MRWASQNSGILRARRGVGGRGKTAANRVRDFDMLGSSVVEGRRRLAIALLRLDFSCLDVIHPADAAPRRRSFLCGRAWERLRKSEQIPVE